MLNQNYYCKVFVLDTSYANYKIDFYNFTL